MLEMRRMPMAQVTLAQATMTHDDNSWLLLCLCCVLVQLILPDRTAAKKIARRSRSRTESSPRSFPSDYLQYRALKITVSAAVSEADHHAIQ